MKLAYSLKEAAQATTLSRATLYRLIADGRLRVRKVGSRTLVPAAELEALLGREPSA